MHASSIIAPAYINSIRNYDDEQGLPEASVNALLQAHDGYLWIATYGGLIRFDGQRFKTYHASMVDTTAPQKPMSGPGSERIVDLLEDKQHRLWIATQDAGVSLYTDGQFLPLPFICDNSCEVMSMAKAQNGQDLWVLTRKGLYLIDSLDLSYKRLDTTAHGPFSRLVITINDEVYVGGINALARVQRDASKIQYIPLPKSNTGLKELATSAQNLWIVTNQYQLYRFNLSTQSFTLMDAHTPIDTHLFSDNKRNNYISDRTQGTRILSESGKEFALAAGQPIQSQAISIDNEGNTWIGSPTLGLWRIHHSIIGLMADTTLKMDGPARAISDDSAGGLWFGMSCGGLRHWEHDGNMKILTRHHPLRDDCISSLLLDHNGTLWIGSSFGFIDRLKGSSVQAAANWPQDGPLNIWQSKNGDYWINSALHTYRLQLDQLGRIRNREKIAQLDGMGISTMSDSRRGGVWFIGNRGAYRIQNGVTVEKWTAAQDGVRQFRALFEDDDGSLWIGTYGGGLLHIKDGKARTFNESNGLFDNTISCILPDEAGRLWLAGNRGFTVIRDRKNIPFNQEPEISVLDSSDGLRSPEINGGTISACHRDHQGRLWFSMIRGFAMIDPKRFKKESLVPRTPATRIESIKVNSNKLSNQHTAITLDTKAANLEISYDCSALSHPELIRYRYRISKKQSNWIDTGSNRTILMPTLPWGRFYFEVQAKSLGGGWSQAARVEFNHPLPWYRYESIWLIASIVALIGLLFMTRGNSDLNRYTKVLERLRGAEADHQVRDL